MEFVETKKAVATTEFRWSGDRSKVVLTQYAEDAGACAGRWHMHTTMNGVSANVSLSLIVNTPEQGIALAPLYVEIAREAAKQADMALAAQTAKVAP